MNLWGSVFTRSPHHRAPFLTARSRRAPVCLCWRSASERHVDVAVVNHLDGLNTQPVHGLRGRKVNYRIAFDLDEQARTAITILLATVWESALDTVGQLRDDAHVAMLGLLRHSHTFCHVCVLQAGGAP